MRIAKIFLKSALPAKQKMCTKIQKNAKIATADYFVNYQKIEFALL